ncbi:antibiotic biosynthesis monooxygenase family protein [Parvularcula sp. LCG005]|uniref:antibiotic biosynthesis monooxygenase family protein n=1 Tax=Parvularcula sp. LCG005 TaxID=3078805 RepID=UPI00397DEA85
MEKLAAEQPGYLGHVSARGADGVGITVSYWRTREDIAAFRAVKDHLRVQAAGRAGWYDWYVSESALVERVSRFDARSQARS